MKNTATKILAGLGALTLTGAAHAEANAELVSAVNGFKTFFTDNSAIIGVAFLAMAFIAIGWKWLKGMSFS